MAQNLAALERTIPALKLAERHAALAEAARSLAAAVDANPNSPGLWQQYRGALESLLEAAGADEDEEAQALADLKG